MVELGSIPVSPTKIARVGLNASHEARKECYLCQALHLTGSTLKLARTVTDIYVVIPPEIADKCAFAVIAQRSRRVTVWCTAFAANLYGYGRS